MKKAPNNLKIDNDINNAIEKSVNTKEVKIPMAVSSANPATK